MIETKEAPSTDAQPANTDTDAPSVNAPPPSPSRRGGWLGLLALLLSLAVAGALGYAYVSILMPLQAAKSALEQGLEQVRTEHQQVLTGLDERLATMDAAVKAVAEGEQAALERFSRFESQLSQLRGQAHWAEREWVLAEVRYLLRTAEDRLRYMRDVGTAQVAARSALARLDQLADPALAPIRQAIQRDLQILKQYKRTEPVAVLGRLEALISALQALPSASARGEAEASAPASASPAEVAAPSEAQSWFDRLTQGLSERIRVIRHDDALNALARNTVDQQAYNLLRLRLESLRLALLQEDLPGYQREVQAMEQWVAAMLEPRLSQPLLAELRGLRESNPFSALPSLEASIAQLSAMLEATGERGEGGSAPAVEGAP